MADPTWPDVSVACVWLPQLPLRMEVLRTPALDGRPLVLGSGTGDRQTVQLCSPEAARAGIRPGLPLREVYTCCRDAVIVQPDPVRIAEVMDGLLGKLQRVSPAIEPGAEWLFLDLRGLAGVYGDDLARLERAVRAAVPSLLGPRIGVAAGKFTAWVAARRAPAVGYGAVPAEGAATFLAPLPVSLLPLELDILRSLDLLGLRTIGDLATLPFGPVQARFGRAGARAWRLAHGQDTDPIVPHELTPTVQVALHADDPLVSAEAIFAALRNLLHRAFGSALLAGRAVRQVRLRARFTDNTSWERLITFKEALAGHESAFRALKAKLELPNGLPPGPVLDLTLELLGLSAEAPKQASLFPSSVRQRDPIMEAARQLHARYGQVPLYQPVEVEPWSRLPERHWALLPFDL